MSDGEALLAYCYDNPEDDAARLVYADWLEEAGDADRAEYLRIQVRRAVLPANDIDDEALMERELGLLAANKQRWFREVPAGLRTKVRFTRGLPSHFEMTAAELRKHDKALRKAGTMRSLQVTAAGDSIRDILDSGLLVGLRSLDLCYVPLAEDDVVALARCPHLSKLRNLHLTGVRCSDQAFRALALSPVLAGLTGLSAGGCNPHALEILADPRVPFRLRRLGTSGFGAPLDLSQVARGPCFERLESLVIGNTLTGFAEMVSSPMMNRLRHLVAWGCHLSDHDLDALTSSPNVAELSSLDLSMNEEIREAIPALLVSANLPRLSSLRLNHLRLGRADLSRLSLPLSDLSLSVTDTTDGRLIELGASPALGGLRSLDLSFNDGITGVGLRALFASPATALRRLDLSRLTYSPGLVAAVAESPRAASLEWLNLSKTRIGPKDVESLAQSPHLGALRRLNLSGSLTEGVARKLLASPLLDQLTHLDITYNRFSHSSNTRTQFRKRRGDRPWKI